MTIPVLGGIVECTSLGQMPPPDSDSIHREFHPRELHVYMDDSAIRLTIHSADKSTAVAGVVLTPEQTWELTAVLDMCARDCNGGWPT